jgi:AraC-like DNA-binding protein
MGMVTGGRKPGRRSEERRTRSGPLEIRSLVPGDPFAGVEPRFGDDTKVLFVVEGPKAVAARRCISLRTLLRRFREGGRTMTRVRQECRADVVATLLEAGVPPKAVARSVGLSGPQALGRFVRACFGLTPAQLRDELRRRAAAKH